MTFAIELQGVSAGYRGRTVLENVDLAIRPGEMVGVLGPNGAGKTTLFRVLTGLCPASRGAVRLFGRGGVERRAAERARLIGVVPQELHASVGFTVEEIVMIGRTASLSRWTPPSARDRHIVERAMAQTDVAEMRARPLNELSAGEKQRAVVAMALAQEPKIILMDEATSHLDVNHQLEILQIVERMNREEGVTVLFISHDLNLAAGSCPRLLLLDRGRVAADGAPAEVLVPERLRRVYHCEMRIQTDDVDGSLRVIPARRAPSRVGEGVRIHVIAGGGSGAEVLRRLALRGYALTCGVLNEGDSDAALAAALDVRAALERPFSAVGEAALASARALAATADALVLCAVAFGPANLANLALAEEALRQGRPVVVAAGVETRDYTPRQEAAARVRALIEGGAREVSDVEDLLAALPQTPAAHPSARLR